MRSVKKILVMRASGGISNRLQAMLGGLAYCLLTGRHLCVDWRDGLYSDDFNNVFPLWFTINGVSSCSTKTVLDAHAQGASLAPLYWMQHLADPIAVEYLFAENDHMLPSNLAKTAFDLTKLDATEDILVSWGWNMSAVLSLAPMLKQTFPSMSHLSDEEIPGHLLRTFVQPTPELIKESTQFHRTNFSSTPVGIHIRHTDMQSPLPRMLETLRDTCTDNDPIFLCTDNIHVETMVQRLFPRTVTREKIFQGNDIPLHCYTPGISNVQKGREAILDLLQLAQCKDIIHYAPSSFALSAILFSGLTAKHIHSVA